MKTFKIAVFIFLLGIIGGIMSEKGYDSIEDARFMSRYIEMKTKFPKLKIEWYRIILKEVERNNIKKIEIRPGYIITGDRIICSIINSESRWEPGAYSEAGARGLLQVMAKYHLPKGTDPKVLYDPAVCIKYGTKIFADNWKSSKENIIIALSLYERGSNKTPNVKYLAEIFGNI